MDDHRIGLIIPSTNCMTEPQFQKYAPTGVGVHVTRVRMTGKWHKPMPALKDDICKAAEVLSDIDPGLIVFHCTAGSMEAGLRGEAEVVRWLEEAGGCRAMTTGQAVREALVSLGVRRLVMVSPYVEATNLLELRYMEEVGFEVVHEFGLGLPGGAAYAQVTPRKWHELILDHRRSEADGYFLSCTNTTMIEAVEACEKDLNRPVVTSNQAALWACLTHLGKVQTTGGLGRLFQHGGEQRTDRQPGAVR